MGIEHDLEPSEVRPKADRFLVDAFLRRRDSALQSIDILRKRDKSVQIIERSALKTKTKALIWQNPRPEDLKRVDRRRK